MTPIPKIWGFSLRNLGIFLSFRDVITTNNYMMLYFDQTIFGTIKKLMASLEFCMSNLCTFEKSVLIAQIFVQKYAQFACHPG